jgi:acyl-CoA thioesterase
MATHEFAHATRIKRLSDGRFAARVSDRWCGPNATANGGYALSIALRAASHASPLPHPLASAASFLARAVPGRVELECQLTNHGRRTALVETTMRQQGRDVLRVATTFGDPAKADGRRGPTLPPPPLPAPEACVDLAPSHVLTHVPIARRFDYRVAEWPGWRSGDPTGVPRLEFWLRPADGAHVDSFGLATVADAGERAVFEIGEFASLTLQLTLYVRAQPAVGWLACRVSTQHVEGGYYEEDCEIWDRTGLLVGQSRQLAVLLG